MNSAENLCRRIIADAGDAVAQKQTETDAECARILAEARAKADAVTAAAAAESKKRRAAFEERAAAAGQKAARNAVLLEKAKILDSVIAEAEKALCALDGAPYVAFVASLFASCGELRDPTVLLQENRASQKAAIAARLKTQKIEFVPSVDGGVLVREGDIDYDCRVGTVLARYRSEHEPELQDILFGDKA